MATVETISQGADGGNTSSRALVFPTGLSEGDLMVLHISGGTFNANFSIPSGWTTLFHETQTGGSSPKGNAMAWKIATSGDVSTGSVTITSGNTTLTYAIMRVSGFDAVESSSALRDSGNTTSVNMTHPTGLAEGDLIILMIGGGVFGSQAGTPSGWTEVYRIQGSSSAPMSRLGAWKIATSGDVSAGNTTITSGNSVYQRGMARISPAPTFTASPLIHQMAVVGGLM